MGVRPLWLIDRDGGDAVGFQTLPPKFTDCRFGFRGSKVDTDHRVSLKAQTSRLCIARGMPCWTVP